MIIDHRYEVIESLGTGTWGDVYKVIDKRSNNVYALKLFKYLSSEQMYEKFSAEEMHRIIRIEHPNLANVLDFGHVRDHIYFISEYYDGMPLKHFKFRKSQLELFYDITVQICYALDALHTQDILHKDLKPENILYRIEGNDVDVKVIDYGFTKIDAHRDHQTVTGSLPYMSPEAYLNKPCGPASDYYSLGVILYRLTTGSFPFSIEQINALITGTQQYFIPKFPAELNADIPPALEKFILRLLEKNPDNRFSSAESIISYINRIQAKQYPFSIEWSLVNKLKFNSYISRAGYSHQLLDYIESVNQHNGKIVSLIGGDGLGKDNILSLFRYHLLNGDFFLFDYTCTKQHHEPFFALIKEFMQSLTKEEVKKYDDLAAISGKFKKYLFESEKDSKRVTQSNEELRVDFESVKKILLSLSGHRPIIFIIRNAQHIHKYTLEFLNFISPFISKHQILILLSFNDYTKVNQITHTVIIQLPPLSQEETADYVRKLLHASVPDSFIRHIWKRSAGNPHFVREILIDLAQKKSIVKNGELNFDYNFGGYALPLRLLHSVYSRMSHMTEGNYQHLLLLAISESSLTRELIIHILKIKDKELYDFLNDAIYNEILSKNKQTYAFTFSEAKQRLWLECDEAQRIRVSVNIVSYFLAHPVYDIESCLGIIKNAILAQDTSAQRKFTYRLFELYEDNYDQDRAYHAMIDVLRLDFLPELKLSQEQLIKDLITFQEKAELTGYCYKASEILPHIALLPEIFEKYYITGTIMFLNEQLDNALEMFQKALALVITGKQQILVWLYFCQIYSQRDHTLMKLYLDKLGAVKLPLELQIAYTDRLSVYYQLKHEMLTAIKTNEEFLAGLPASQDARVLIRLASMHNNLGVYYSLQKNIEEADDHLNSALGIWSRFNIKRYLGLIYNNLADLSLKQGVTEAANLFSQRAFKNAQEQGLTMTMALARLNMGEVRIKLGEFQQAEEYLDQAKELILSVKSERFLDSIMRNLALVKSKVVNFGNYYRFIMDNEPDLIKGVIHEINPLIKTYFYYLYELGNVKKISKLLRKNAHINYHHLHEDEFFYNTQSLVALLNKDYPMALEHLKNAMRYAGEIRNHYALTVFHLAEIECYIGLKDYIRAEDILDKATILAEKYHYSYWLLKLRLLKVILDLVNPGKPLRQILRELLDINSETSKREYFILNIQSTLLIIQILNEMNAEVEAQSWFTLYQQLLEKSTEGIEKEDRHAYLLQNYYFEPSPKSIRHIDIPSRYKNIRARWNELQYSLLNIQNAERIKYFIDKGLKDIIAPWKYQLMIYSEKLNAYTIYLSSNSENNAGLSPEILQLIDKSFKLDTIIADNLHNAHYMIVPLQIRSHKIGFMIIMDRNELSFTKLEISLVKSIRQHITTLIMRIQDYSEITQRMQMMNKLMSITHSLLRVMDIKTLENDIVSACIDFTGSSRGFLIKRDIDGNLIYQVAIDYAKRPVSNISVISKSTLRECQSSKLPVLTYNALEDKRFKNSISVQDYKLHAIFCAPLYVNEVFYGFIYLDNFLDNTKEMYLNTEIITLLIDQIVIALKNALQYDSIIKKSHELQSLEALKDEFMAIVSHELNTPLTSLQGYVSRLKRNMVADEEERRDIILKIDNGVKKLIVTSNDIMTMNSYNLKESLPKTQVLVYELLGVIHSEIEIFSRNRKMTIKLEIESGLPELTANWEALHLMIYNIVLNAIRFTNDFGTIIIGARKSAFQQEKINDKETLVIFIQDNGIGIPEHQVKNVFRKFYELNEIYAHKSGSVEYRSSGLGLGLSTSKRIAELHSGIIWIKSKENEGTTVFVSLPFKS